MTAGAPVHAPWDAALRVRLARAEDDGALRALLRETPMEGRVRLGFEREPSFFGCLDLESERHATVVLEDARGGPPFGMGTRVVRRARLDGRAVRLGYLTQLRVGAGRRIHRRALARAYELLLRERGDDELDFDLTSIAADNAGARRLLERGLPGLPRYVPLAAYETLAIAATAPARTGRYRVVVDHEGLAEAAPAFRSLAGLQVLAPGAAGATLTALDGGTVVATAALAEPDGARQLVVRGYAGALGRLRPAANAVLGVAGRPTLPPPGSPLRTRALGGLALAPGHEEAVVDVVRAARRLAAEEGARVLLFGACAGDPRLALLRSRFPVRSYATVLYAVCARGQTPPSVEAGRLEVEVAAL